MADIKISLYRPIFFFLLERNILHQNKNNKSNKIKFVEIIYKYFEICFSIKCFSNTPEI